MHRFVLICLALAWSSCGRPASPPKVGHLQVTRLGPPNALVGQVQPLSSTTLSRWYGKAGHDPEAPVLFSDQRLAWIGTTPLRLSWRLSKSTLGPRQLITAVRPENIRWGASWLASVYWQQDSGEVQILWQQVVPAQKENASSPPWLEVEVSIPEGEGNLIFGTQWEISGLAQQHGLRVAWQEPEIRYAAQERELPDIVLISIDTLRHDALTEMPELQSLMEQGWQWQEAYSPSNWTLPAMASLFTGLSIEEHGVGRGPFAEQPTGKAEQRTFHALSGLPTAASFLQSQGYATGMWFQNPFLEAWSGLDAGFERYVHCADRPLSAAEDALAWWEQQSGPRFLVLHEFTPHAPYAPEWQDIPDPLASLPTSLWFGADLSPEERLERFDLSTEEKAWIQKRYFHQLKDLDQGLSEIVKALRAKSPDCLILIHADHGEELWDDGRFEHGFSFDNSVIQVPLALIWPAELLPAVAQDPAPAHQLLSLALELLAERRGLAPSPMPQNYLRQSGSDRPQGGLTPLRISSPLYRSDSGGRSWDATLGWQFLPFDKEGSPGPPAQLPLSTAQQLLELGYTGEVAD